MSVRATEDRRLGRVTVLGGERGGKYPHGSSVLVEGSEGAALIDPSLAVVPRAASLPRVDVVVNSHCHEDHIAGNFLFPDASWRIHRLDLPGLRSLDAMMAIYGYDDAVLAPFRRIVVEQFHYVPREDALGFEDGDVVDLGGVRLRAIHSPGHTRGHCFFHAEPDDVLYLGDVDLTTFGPYYGDAWSDLESFERTLAMARGLRARWYVTFHHVGIVEGHDAFLDRLGRYTEVIRRREERLAGFIAEPHTLDEIVRHRFVYRAQDELVYADPVERRSMAQHLARLLASGRVEEVEPGRFRARG